MREALADRPVTPSLWEGTLLAEQPHEQRSPGPFGSILMFEELDEITRDFMLMEFEVSGWVQSSPTCRSLSPLGRDALPLFLHAAIGSADETALIRAISHGRYWNDGIQAGDDVVSLVPLFDYLRASVRLATHEFNAWYVRGLAARLLSEGETKCEVYVAAAVPCREGACSFRDREIMAVARVRRGCPQLIWRGRPAVPIPFSEGCYHSIRRVRG